MSVTEMVKLWTLGAGGDGQCVFRIGGRGAVAPVMLPAGERKEREISEPGRGRR